MVKILHGKRVKLLRIDRQWGTTQWMFDVEETSIYRTTTVIEQLNGNIKIETKVSATRTE